jgi:phage tail-like protein
VRDPQKYFVLNKEEDYHRGFAYHTRYLQDGLQITAGSISQGGVYFSRLLDSREKETVWHRLVVQSESLGDASIRFTVYASEERLVRFGSGLRDIGAVISDEGLSWQEKENAFLPYKIKSLFNPSDALLHEAKGRYLWFSVELYGQGEASPKISHIKIYFPRRSWLGYLPEIYQADPESKSFVERYLNIFQSLYEDLEQEISRISRFFDPDVVDGDFIQWLAEWVAIDDAYIWNEEQLRHLIKNSMRIYRMRGTRLALAEIVELYLGERPCIVEHYQLDGFSPR